VKYSLRGLKARSFTSSIALNDTTARAESPLTFFVLGDGKTLWTSQPVQVPHSIQECNVNVTAIETLELRVHCPGSISGAHAVWIDPYLTTGLTKSELEDYLKRKPYPHDLRILAVIDGADELHLTATEARWAHVSFFHPNDVKINGVAWNPQANPTMPTLGLSQLFGKQMQDLSKVRMKKLRGRGQVELRPSKDVVTVVFIDPEPGVDIYEVILTFGE
jgi:hypothetical protein